MKGSLPIQFALVLLILFHFGCTADPKTSGFTVNVRLANEPDVLHPIFSKSSIATQIESFILLPLAEFDPLDLKLSPLLIEEIPVAEKVTSGKHANGKVYKIKIRKEATWSDGQPVTAEDYLFTIKSVYNPYVAAQSWTAFTDFISEVDIDPSDSRQFSVYVDSTYILATEAVVNFNIYPAHVYDPQQIMSRFTLDDLRKKDIQWSAEQDTLLKQFATGFESPVFFREKVVGSGPYVLDYWTTGEFIRLKRIKNFWGDKLENPPLQLQAYPDEINYRIILDPAAAITALKAGELDLLSEIPAADFVALKNDPQWKDKIQYATPPLWQVYSLELNNRDSILADKRIRQALAYAIDYDGMMNTVIQGLGQRTIGPFHPSKSYYDKALKPIQQDINHAIELIKEAGWSDSNKNGIPDKKIGGKTRELELHLKIPNKAEGIAIANIVKENARKAGIEIVIDALDASQFSQDIKQGNYEISTGRKSEYPTDDDPYPNWHSDSDRVGGGNRSGFHTPELDSVITVIRTSPERVDREKAYMRFQEILYENQPSIWLYVPLERILASSRIELITSSRRPGYFENLFRLAE